MRHEATLALFVPTSIRKSEQQQTTPDKGCHARAAKMEIMFAPVETLFLLGLPSNSTLLAVNEKRPEPPRRTCLLLKKLNGRLSRGSSARSRDPITVFASSIFSWR